MNENVPEQYQGMDRVDARKKIVSDLEELGLLEHRVGDGADDTHQRVHPDQTVIFGGQQGKNGQQRRQGIGQYVQIGRA